MTAWGLAMDSKPIIDDCRSIAAGERHQPLESAGRAADPGEAPGQDAALQVATELVLYELWIPRTGRAAHPRVVQPCKQRKATSTFTRSVNLHS